MSTQDSHFAIVIHGGVFHRPLVSQESVKSREMKFKGLKQALLAGFTVLENRGSSLDAVQTAVKTLESLDFFNAGRGSVLTNSGVYELDAGIMDGFSGKAGGVAAIQHVKHPIDLARHILDSPYVLLTGRGAEHFAQKSGLALVANDYFDNARAHRSLEETHQGGSPLTVADEDSQTGTVGAVALDIRGHLAAASSTGGLSNKPSGRIGDAPITGAGFYAGKEVAVACTGVGESFMVPPAAYGVANLLEREEIDLELALQRVLNGELSRHALDGGMIAINKKGEFAISYNTPWMYRAWMKYDGTYGLAVGPQEAETGRWPIM